MHINQQSLIFIKVAAYEAAYAVLAMEAFIRH